MAQPIAEVLPLSGDLEAVEKLREAAARILEECRKVIVGQDAVLEQLLIGLFARGHCLLVGVPGLAKTLMIRTLADSMNLSFSRVQFTPDLMPSDITGTDILQEDKLTGTREFRFIRGPLFANVVLADEINRTPPKTQAALLEAMQEKQVTVSGKRHVLPNPFFVLATQNPIEQEGTYPLPEAQQDRFMFNILVGYPTEDEEYRIIEATTSGRKVQLQRVISAEELIGLQELVERVPVPPQVMRYAMKLARLTRRQTEGAPDFTKRYVEVGAGPRASQYLVIAAKARAVLQGRPYASIGDVKAVAMPVLRHRMQLSFAAESERITGDDIVRRLLDTVSEG